MKLFLLSFLKIIHWYIIFWREIIPLIEAVLLQPYRIASSPNAEPGSICPTGLPFFNTSSVPSVNGAQPML